MSAQDPENYTFPTNRLRTTLKNPKRTPLVLVSCGSFSPLTYLHLRMFEAAADYTKFNTEYEVIGGYLSPVNDAYKKAGLVSAHHRINMCRLAVEECSSWIMVDTWEPLQKEYQPTARVLDHFDTELSKIKLTTPDGKEEKKVQVSLLAGADLVHTFSTPGVWHPSDLDHILGKYGAFIIERAGTDMDEALQNLDRWRDRIYVVNQLIQNDVSSTKIRLILRRDMSIRYLVPPPVITYIEQHGLYTDDGNEGRKEGAGAAPEQVGSAGEKS